MAFLLKLAFFSFFVLINSNSALADGIPTWEQIENEKVEVVESDKRVKPYPKCINGLTVTKPNWTDGQKKDFCKCQVMADCKGQK